MIASLGQENRGVEHECAWAECFEKEDGDEGPGEQQETVCR